MSSQIDIDKSILTSDRDPDQEFREIPIHQLSGDENAEKSVLLSEIQEKKSNFFLTTMTIMKTVIGVGVLGLPNVMKNLGWAVGITLFILTSFLNHFSCTLLLKVKNLSHHSNYSTIGYNIFKSKWILVLIYFLVLFNNFGVCMAELTIFKQTFSKIIQEFLTDYQHNWYFQPWFVTGICLSIVLIPFTLVTKIQKLKYLALIGITAILCFVVSVVINFIKLTVIDGKVGPDIRAFPVDAIKAISSIPNILLAFLYQMNFFPIYKGMDGSTDRKMLNSSLIGTVCCFVIYSATGILGYITYGSNIQDSNFLYALQKNETGVGLYVIMNTMFLISVFCSFPLMFFGARNNFIAIFKVLKSPKPQDRASLRHGDSIAQISEYIVTDSSKKRKLYAQIIFYVLTFILLVAIMVVAVTVGELGSIFNIVGAVASNSIGFILPSLFYLALIVRKKKPKRAIFFGAAILFTLSVPFGILAVVCEFIG